MNMPIVSIHQDHVVAASFDVATYFDKRHDNVIRAIENLKEECEPDYWQLNFEVSFNEVKMPKGGMRKQPFYRMTKDGFTLLVMGFTGKAALKFKIDYINAFNQMAAMLQQQPLPENTLKIGAVVRLISGGPQMNIGQLLYNDHGIVDQAEVIWFKQERMYKERLPVACLKPVDHAKQLQQFWDQVYQYGISHLNHSKFANQIALNINQLRVCLKNLPPHQELEELLKTSSGMFPRFYAANIEIYSAHEGKWLRCFLFELQKPVLEHTQNTGLLCDK